MCRSITNSGAAYEGLFFELQTAIDLTTNNTIRMNFWSDTAVSILLKLEQGTAFTEVSANHKGAGWEELQFTFTASSSYSKLVVFVDPTGTKAGTFYMDDIVQVSLGDAPVITLIGDASIRLTQGDPYTEQGATASDTEDGDVTSTIVIGGNTVVTSTPGTYEVTYTVTDSDGNTTVATRSVQVNEPGVCDADQAQSVSASDLNVTMASAVTIIEDGATFKIKANPDFDNAINTSCKVGEVTKQGVAAWDNIQLNLNAKLDFNSNSGLKIKVWSARPNTAVLIKLEEIGNQGNSKEIGTMTTSVTSAWEELTYPVGSGESNKFNKVVIFFDLNANNTSTYYFDDLKLYGNGSGTGGGGGIPANGDIASNGGFESGNLDGWTLYANGGTATMDSTEAQTGDWCVKLYASAPSGLNPTLKQERRAAGSVVVGDKVQVTFSYKGSLTGISGTYSIQSFVEATNGASQIETFDVTPTATWQTFTTTYTVTGAMQGGDVSGGITMEFVAICGGVAGCSSTLYLDDISLIINP